MTVEKDGHYELDEPVFVHADKDMYNKLHKNHFLRALIDPKKMYVATSVVIRDEYSKKRYYKLMGIPDYIDGDILLLVEHIRPN